MKLGILSKLYINTGSYEIPTWLAVTKISDLSVKPTWDKADSSARESRVKTQRKTMVMLDITGKIKVKDDDAAYLLFWTAFQTDAVIDLLVLNGANDTVGVRGYRASFQVFDFSEDQGLGNVLYSDFSLSPTDDQGIFAAVVEAGPTLTYTAIGST